MSGLVFLLLCGACADKATGSGGCPSLSSASVEPSSWRDVISASLAGAPPDSMAKGIFMGLVAGDSTIVQPYGGRVVYTFHQIQAIRVEMLVQQWTAFGADPKSDPEGRVTELEFGLGPLVLQSCK
jgi:hypothetical protein